MKKNTFILFLVISSLFLLPSLASAQQLYYVQVSESNGSGSKASPFNNLFDAFSLAESGDSILVMPGTFELDGTLSTITDGSPHGRITTKAYDPNNKPILTLAGRVMDVNNIYHTFESLIFDSQFSDDDVIQVRAGGNNFILRDCEVRNAQKDGIDISSADSVLIENCEIHHLLAGTIDNQLDAHGIVATGQQNLIIRACEIYYCSGDCFQTDPNRGYPLWDSVLIENTQMWTGPLPQDAAGWFAGESPGENAVDTKINIKELANGYRPKIHLKNIEAWGWTNNGYISLRAAFNIKEQVECIIDGVVCYDNQLAFRLRGPGSKGGAYVTLMNVLAYDNEIIIRPEDNIEKLHIYNSTFDKDNSAVWFQEAGGGYNPNEYEMLNCLFIGTKPTQAEHNSNLSVDSNEVIDRSERNYHLTDGCSAIDAGVDILEVLSDIEGNPRMTGFYDIGAYEFTGTGIMHTPKKDEEFIVFPNPFSFVASIKILDTDNEIQALRVYSINGLLLREETIRDKNSITFLRGDLASGIYIIELIGRNGIVGNKMIIVL